MIQLRGGYTTADRRLDRLPQPDARNANYPIRTLLAAGAAPRSYTWSVPIHLDQGQEGACVGFSFAHELAARPVAVGGVVPEFARAIYWEAQRLDDWPGGSYVGADPFYEGTSVIAGAKTLVTAGHYREYRWADNVNDLVLTIGHWGPAVLGIDWTEGMFEPNVDGQLYPTGAVAGGHAILAHAVDVRRKRIWLWNSWGPDWGVNGRGWLSFEHMAYLLTNGGEACIPVRVRKPAAKEAA